MAKTRVKTDHDSDSAFCITFQHNWISQTRENMSNNTLLWLTVFFLCRTGLSSKPVADGKLFPWESGPFPFPCRLFPIPSYSNSQFCHQFPFPWDSHGISIPIGNPIPMVISSGDSCRPLRLLFIRPTEHGTWRELVFCCRGWHIL